MGSQFGMIHEFGHVFHRYLNDVCKLEHLVSTADRFDVTTIAEGDVCWYEEDGDVLLVMYHPESMNTIPSRDEIERRVNANEVLQLEAVLQNKYAHIPKVFELKAGRGSPKVALTRMLELLSRYCSDQYWIDAFSPDLLSVVKAISPTTLTSLHTRLGVWGPFLAKTAFENPPLSLRKLSRLNQVDAVTVTYKYSPARFVQRFGGSIDAIHKWVYKSGKELIFGGVEEKALAKEIRRSRAIAVYRKWEK